MDLERAKKILIDFMAGGRPSEEEVRSAYLFLTKHDPMALERLKSGLIRDEQHEELCGMVASEMDILSEMGMAALEKEMPEVAVHIQTCENCRRLWWQIKPAWELTRASRRPKLEEKTLADVIVVDFGKRGEVRGISGMPAGEQVRMAMGLGPLGDNLKEWRLEDVESGVVASLLIWTSGPAKANLKVILADLENRPITAGRIKIEIYYQDDKLPLLQGPLEQAMAAPIRLRQGDWLIILTWTDQDRSRIFKIPFKIGHLRATRRRK